MPYASGNVRDHMPRLRYLLAAAFVVAVSCSPSTFELVRIQRADVRVLPGADGFLHPITGVVHYVPKDWQDRPVLAVKIGNTAPERPQAGIDKADLIYEEVVEGGATRLIALFSTEAPERIGPVRSARFVDPAILRPIAGLIGYSGGVPPVVAAVRAVPGLKDVGAFAKSAAYRRDPARRAPYNLYTSATALWAGEEGGPPTQPLFGFLSSADDLATGGGDSALEARFAFTGSGVRVRYAYDDRTGKYGRFQQDTPHNVEGTNGEGQQLAFRNVLIQYIGITPGSGTDQAGGRTQDTDVIGNGSAVLLRGGRAFRGTWTRSSAEVATRFLDSDGEQFRLAPGQTIIELVPNGRELALS